MLYEIEKENSSSSSFEGKGEREEMRNCRHLNDLRLFYTLS